MGPRPSAPIHPLHACACSCHASCMDPQHMAFHNWLLTAQCGPSLSMQLYHSFSWLSSSSLWLRLVYVLKKKKETPPRPFISPVCALRSGTLCLWGRPSGPCRCGTAGTPASLPHTLTCPGRVGRCLTVLLFHLVTSVSHQASFPVVGHLCIIVFGETVCPGFSLVLTWVVFCHCEGSLCIPDTRPSSDRFALKASTALGLL